MARRYLKDFDKGAHSVYLLYYHLVCVTKYRRKVINDDVAKAIMECLDRTCRDNGGKLVEFNGEPDHIHALINMPPKVEMSKFIGQFKGRSSYDVRRDFPEQVNVGRDGVFWSPSYCLLTTGGAPIDVIKRYIQSQEGFAFQNDLEE